MDPSGLPQAVVNEITFKPQKYTADAAQTWKFKVTVLARLETERSVLAQAHTSHRFAVFSHIRRD